MIAIDKQAHFWWGWAVSASLYPLFGWAGLILTAIMALGKEYRDSKGHGTPDKWDFVATVIGGIVGSLAVSVIIYIAEEWV